MRGRALAAAAFLGVSGCAAAGLVPTPPEAHRGESLVYVYFASDVTSACIRMADPSAPLRMAFDAKLLQPLDCYAPQKDTLVLPNPCEWQDPFDGYAKLACHGMGHANGWEHGPDGGWLQADNEGDGD